MDELKERVKACNKCALSKTRGKIIFGEGNPHAEILVIGEAPGREEDKIGRPFVGKSGELLNKILTVCGFSRNEHIYISNIVRCHPPGNRVPSVSEVQTCFPYLLEQIGFIDPKIIITLGATPLKELTDNKGAKITKLRGRWINWNDRLLMPVYHPAALLRNPALKADTWEDFKNVVRKYRELVDRTHQTGVEID